MLSSQEISDTLKAKQNEYQSYIDDFDRTADGAGSDKDKDRFSAQDIRNMFSERGDLSKAEGAQMVLDYADKAEDAGSSMGGGSERELDKLRGYLNDTPEEIEVDPEPIQLSKRLTDANAYVDSFDNNVLSNQGSIIKGLDINPETGKSSNLQKFEDDRVALADKYLTDAFSLKLGDGFKPTNRDGTPRDSVLEEERAVQGIA